MTLTVDEALQRGVAAHQAGNIVEADKYYTAVLNVQPKHPDANHNMGILAVGTGKPKQAVAFFKIATEVNPDNEHFWVSYISNLLELKQKNDARRGIKKAIKNGISKEVLKQLERRTKNHQTSHGSVQDPEQSQVLPVIEFQCQGRTQQALDLIHELLKVFQTSPVLFNLRGCSYSDLGRSDDAIDNFDKALKLLPSYADAHCNMGNSLYAKGEVVEALKSYGRAIKIDANHSNSYHNMGHVLQADGDLDGAIRSYKLAVKADPNNALAFNNIGTVLAGRGEFDGATKNYQQCIKIKPDYAEAFNNLGVVFSEQGQFDIAESYYEHAIKLKIDFPEAHYGLATVFEYKRDFKTAIENYAKALTFKSNYSAARAQKLYLQAYLCCWADRVKEQDLIPLLGISCDSVSSFAMFSLEDSPSRHRVRAELLAQKKFKYPSSSFDLAAIKKKSRIRVAYFSVDFRDHPVAHLMMRALELHYRHDFEVYAYSCGAAGIDDADDDIIRERIISAVDHFRDIFGVADLDAAEIARADNIDIAIDLTGYTKNSRTGIFAHRAAPIQINYLGFPGTMGAEFMDYIVVDDVLVPDELREHYSESVIRLPSAYMATDNTREISASALSRQEMNLPEDGFVFCVFNNSYKITPKEFNIWVRLLHQVEGSVLWLRSFHKTAEENLCREAQDRGIDPCRLIFAEVFPMPEHLARQRLADLFLDTFIFNAHSTAVDALWAGLPVVTKLGEGFAARVAGSLLTSLGMTELVTSTEEAYEALALDLATNPERLSRVKQTLSENLLTTPLFDSEQFTKDLESGYRQAYQRHADGLAPADIQVA